MHHRAREEGRSGYTLSKLLNLWMNGFTSFSVKPLRIATYIEAHQLHDNTQLLQQEAAYNAEYDALMETWETLSEAIAAEEGT